MDPNQVPQGAPPGMPPGGFQGRPPGGFPGGPGARGGLFLAGPIGIALLVLTYIVMAIALWQFLKKAGLTPVVALLMLVPVVNLGVALWAAFTEWPVLREVARLKELVATYEMRASGAAQAPGHTD
jgi:hypothetical protein